MNRPLITYFIFTYNQEKYVQQAVESALAQDYSPLEIIISDDASTDNTAAIIKNMIAQYSGTHKVQVNVNPVNLGIGAHVNKAFEMAHGELIVMAAGDDISLPHRVSYMTNMWLESNKKVNAIYSGAKVIDAHNNDCGVLDVALSEIKLNAQSLISYRAKNGSLLLIGACAAYTTDLNQPFGGLLPRVNVEDIPLTIRASLCGGVIYTPEQLLLYRRNVSVWLPRKLKAEGFTRHKERLLHRIKTNYYVAKQIVHDVDCVNTDKQTRRAAKQRLIATEFVQRCIEKEHFLFLHFLQSLNKTSYWRYMLFPAIIVANPRLHRLIYKVYSLLKGS